MPHHHGRSKRSTSTNTRSNPHTSSGSSKATHVSSGAAQRQKAKVNTSINKNKKDKPSFLPITLQVIKGIGEALTEGSKEYNLARRKKHITKYNTSVPPSERIDMTDEMISSNEGLNTLREKTNYKTNQDINRERQDRNGGPPVKKVVGGQTILAAAPTEAEVSQSDATNAAETKLTKRRVKARGRKMNIYAQSKDKLTLGKKTLLGVV